MRQVMPHRNNIGVRRPDCKIFLSERTEMVASATFLPQSGAARVDDCNEFLMSDNGLHMSHRPNRPASPTFRHS